MPPARSLRLLAASVVAGVLLLAGGPMTAEGQDGPAGLPPTGFEEGEPFPTVALPALDGEERVSLADLRGHKLILHVFASW